MSETITEVSPREAIGLVYLSRHKNHISDSEWKSITKNWSENAKLLASRLRETP